MGTMAASYHLAVFNIGRAAGALDSYQMRDFMAGLDLVNALAEQAPGFVWRYTAEGTNNATAARPLADDILINLGVWESRELLWDFGYRSQHLDFLRRRREFFQHMAEAFLVLWWIPAGHIPTLDEAIGKRDGIRCNGPAPGACSVPPPFDPPVHSGVAISYSGGG